MSDRIISRPSSEASRRNWPWPEKRTAWERMPGVSDAMARVPAGDLEGRMAALRALGDRVPLEPVRGGYFSAFFDRMTTARPPARSDAMWGKAEIGPRITPPGEEPK